MSLGRPSPDRPEPVIAVVGSLNIDLIAYTERVPGPGETLMGDDFQMGFGGKGANQAVMAARFGATVRMIGALGADVYADMTFDNLARQRVDATHVARVAGSSGVAPIWVERDGTNRIIVVAGANGRVDAGSAAEAVRAIGDAAVVIGQLEIPQRVTAEAFRAAHDLGAITILNPAPAAELDPDLLANADWLIPNEHEFSILSGTLVQAADVATEDRAFAGYAGRTGRRLLVTLGSRGVAVVSTSGSVDRVPSVPVKAIDTTGAGDAFVGGFAYGLAAGFDELRAARLGVACASDSVTRTGTQSSFASPERARELIELVRASP